MHGHAPASRSERRERRAPRTAPWRSWLGVSRPSGRPRRCAPASATMLRGGYSPPPTGCARCGRGCPSSVLTVASGPTARRRAPYWRRSAGHGYPRTLTRAVRRRRHWPPGSHGSGRALPPAAAAAAEAAAAAAAAATAAVVATPPPQPAESRRGLVLSWPLQQAHDGHLNRTYAAALRKALLRVQGRAALVLSVSCGIGLQPIVAAQARPKARTRSLTRTVPP